MTDRLRRLLDAFDPALPLERARTIPSSWYFDPGLYDLERRTAFVGWQCVGRADQVAAPGAYLTADVAGEPVAVVRDADGTLRAFHNVCRHRAAPVLTAECGTATKLRCRYHGWTYDLAGRLRGTPEFEGVADFCRDDFGLVPLAVDAWGPTVWVHPGRPKQPLAEYLHAMPERMGPLGVERLRWHSRQTYDLACNWKVYVDNYLDGGYHVNSVHPGLAGVLDYSQYRTELYATTNVQVSPLKPAEVGAVEGAVRTGDNAYYWWVFPNFMFNLYEGVLDTNVVQPLGPERCRVVFDLYFAEGTPERFIGPSLEVTDRVQQEDVGICEEVQRGLASRSFDTGRFSVRREAAGYEFHRLLARRLRAAIG